MTGRRIYVHLFDVGIDPGAAMRGMDPQKLPSPINAGDFRHSIFPDPNQSGLDSAGAASHGGGQCNVILRAAAERKLNWHDDPTNQNFWSLFVISYKCGDGMRIDQMAVGNAAYFAAHYLIPDHREGDHVAVVNHPIAAVGVLNGTALEPLVASGCPVMVPAGDGGKTFFGTTIPGSSLDFRANHRMVPPGCLVFASGTTGGGIDHMSNYGGFTVDLAVPNPINLTCGAASLATVMAALIFYGDQSPARPSAVDVCNRLIDSAAPDPGKLNGKLIHPKWLAGVPQIV